MSDNNNDTYVTEVPAAQLDEGETAILYRDKDYQSESSYQSVQK